MAKVIAQYDRPRFAVQKVNYSRMEGSVPGESDWETVITETNEFTAKQKAEEYTKKNDVRTRVLDREADE